MVAYQAPPTTSRVIAITGRVEQLNERNGIAGWAIDRSDPGRSLDIELWAGATRLGTTVTGGERPDACAALGVEGRPGFRFGSEVWNAVRAAAADGPSEDLTVRVATGTTTTLLPGVIRSLELFRFDPTAGAPVGAETLAQWLAIHARSARRALDRPLPPVPDRATGFLESLSMDELGRIWITGWIVDDGIRDRPVVILDDGKHAAGFAYATVARPDLPPGHIGFAGLLHTRWRPGSSVPPALLMADDDSIFLEPLRPTPLLTQQAHAPLIAQQLARGDGDCRDVLRDLFHLAPEWTVPADEPSADRLHVDAVAILPGFGAFVSGWVLSARKDADGFTLKVGNRLIVADHRSMTRHDRPDLVATYPNMADATGAAGFVALFRDGFDADDSDDLIVKVRWSDGSFTNDRVASNTIRVFGVTTPLDAAYRFYPKLEAEYFFADFAHHAALDARRQAGDVRGYAVAAVGDVLILAAPAAASDLFLMYDDAVRNAAALPPHWGIAILAESDQSRALAVSLFAHLSQTTGRRCSLFFTRRGRPSSDAIDTMMTTLGATRLAFVAAGVSLTDAGWAAIAQAGERLTLLGVHDPVSPGATARVGLDAFVADLATWRALASRAAPRIGGVALAPGGPAADTVPDAAFSLGNRASTPLIARINMALGHHDG